MSDFKLSGMTAIGNNSLIKFIQNWTAALGRFSPLKISQRLVAERPITDLHAIDKSRYRIKKADIQRSKPQVANKPLRKQRVVVPRQTNLLA